MTDTVPDLYYDPFDEVIDAQPYEVWRRMRDEAPVYRNDTYDFYALSRFDDVEAAHLDPKTFSSAHGTVLELMSSEQDSHGDSSSSWTRPITPGSAGWCRGPSPRAGSAHSSSAFASCVGSSSTSRRTTTTFDFVQDYGARLPAMVIASLLGVPLEDQAWARSRSTRCSTSSRASG